MPGFKIQELNNATSVVVDDVIPIVRVAGTATDNKITVGNLRKSMIGTYSCSFIGDPYVRFRILDTSVVTDSKIVVSIQRPSTLDADNSGYMYIANVCNVVDATGFDVDIVCLDWGMGDATESEPFETIILCYLIG